MRELRWYLEDFLDYPFPPETDHAERVQRALRGWGKEAFESLLGGRASARMFDAAVQDDYAQLQLQIASDDAQVLAWPWEALCLITRSGPSWLMPAASSASWMESAIPDLYRNRFRGIG